MPKAGWIDRICIEEGPTKLMSIPKYWQICVNECSKYILVAVAKTILYFSFISAYSSAVQFNLPIVCEQ